MTPQSNFMVVAPIIREREMELRQLLDSMNHAPGQVDPNNTLIPFAEFGTLHFARVIILDDKTTEDVRVYGLRPRSYPLYLAFLGDVDGDANAFLGELIKRARNGLARIFSCCEGFTSDADLLAWMKRHHAPAIAAYVNWRGRTVRQIREEATLYEALQKHIEQNNATFQDLPPRNLHETLRSFVNAEKTGRRLTLSPESATPLGWQIRNLLHMIGMPLLVLIVSPLLLLLAPFYVIALRHLEKTDPEVCPTADHKHSEDLSRIEDHDVNTYKPCWIYGSASRLVGIVKTYFLDRFSFLRPVSLARNPRFPLRLSPASSRASSASSSSFDSSSNPKAFLALPLRLVAPLTISGTSRGRLSNTRRWTASAQRRYVSTLATTTRASTVKSSMPTRDTLTYASITIPLSRIRSRTSARLLLPGGVLSAGLAVAIIFLFPLLPILLR